MIKLSTFEQLFGSKAGNKILETWDPEYYDYGDPPELTDPNINYSKKDRFFDLVVDISSYDMALLKGRPVIGGGIWILLYSDEIPLEYLYFYDDDPDSYEIGEGTYESYATDLWKNHKIQVGEGIKDYTNSGPGVSNEKILIKIDKDLKKFLIEDFEDSMSSDYVLSDRGKFSNGVGKKYTNPKRDIGIRSALYFLENYPE